MVLEMETSPVFADKPRSRESRAPAQVQESCDFSIVLYDIRWNFFQQPGTFFLKQINYHMRVKRGLTYNILKIYSGMLNIFFQLTIQKRSDTGIQKTRISPAEIDKSFIHLSAYFENKKMKEVLRTSCIIEFTPNSKML